MSENLDFLPAEFFEDDLPPFAEPAYYSYQLHSLSTSAPIDENPYDISINTTVEDDWQEDLDQLSKEERVQYALCDYLKKQEAHLAGKLDRAPTFTQVAKMYGVSRHTLQRRYAGTHEPPKDAHSRQQFLFPSEKEALINSIKQLEAWNFPPFIEQVKTLARDILKARQKDTQVGVNWVSKFLKRHPELHRRWARALERDRSNNWTLEIATDWFQRLQKLMAEKGISQADVYNMDKKGISLGSAGMNQVVCSKHVQHPNIKEPTNTEWSTLIECISGDGKKLPPFFIFKGKIQKKAWLDELQADGKVCISSKGWTDRKSVV